MFSKIDKKVLIILIIVLAITLIIGFAIYKYMAGFIVEIKNSAGGVQTEQNTDSVPSVRVQAQGNGDGMLTICLDKCGDGVCQTTDSDCSQGNLNCICPEIPQECPQDCE